MLQLGLKSVMDELWALYFTLQFLVYLNKYAIAFPANAVIYGNLLKNLIEFTAINPMNLIKLVYP